MWWLDLDPDSSYIIMKDNLHTKATNIVVQVHHLSTHRSASLDSPQWPNEIQNCHSASMTEDWPNWGAFEMCVAGCSWIWKSFPLLTRYCGASEATISVTMTAQCAPKGQHARLVALHLNAWPWSLFHNRGGTLKNQSDRGVKELYLNLFIRS